MMSASGGARRERTDIQKPTKMLAFCVESVSVYQTTDYKRKSSCNRGYPERGATQQRFYQIKKMPKSPLYIRVFEHFAFSPIFVIFALFRCKNL